MAVAAAACALSLGGKVLAQPQGGFGGAPGAGPGGAGIDFQNMDPQQIMTMIQQRIDDSFREQMIPGNPYWRARLDSASGIDVYGNNGIAVGDIDGDGRDEVYICQPGGLPNRLYRFRPDGRALDR